MPFSLIDGRLEVTKNHTRDNRHDMPFSSIDPVSTKDRVDVQIERTDVMFFALVPLGLSSTRWLRGV
jgi:hypothetical protein